VDYIKINIIIIIIIIVETSHLSHSLLYKSLKDFLDHPVFTFLGFNNIFSEINVVSLEFSPQPGGPLICIHVPQLYPQERGYFCYTTGSGSMSYSSPGKTVKCRSSTIKSSGTGVGNEVDKSHFAPVTSSYRLSNNWAK
jgi:hypothetical protein